MIEIPPLTQEMLLVLGILAFTILLFVTEMVRVDVAAMLVMIVVGLLGLVPPTELFNGFGSNAVISIIAIMIIGAGLDKAGVMTQVAHFILKIGGKTEKGILPVVLGSVGTISGFMQNVGAAALFIPVLGKISARTRIPLSRLLIPMGFCAILGGTITLVGSSPLILLNDLIDSANQTLPPAVAPMQPFALFDTAPIGLALVGAGIIYFLVAGHWVLPALKTEATQSITPIDYFRQRYGLKEGEVFELLVIPNSPLAHKTILEYEQQVSQPTAIIALLKGKHLRISPAPDVTLEPGDSIAMMGDKDAIQAFAEQFHLMLKSHIGIFTEMLVPTQSGVSEVVIPQDSQVIGQSLLDIRMRKTYGLSVLGVIRHHKILHQGLRDLVLQSGDSLLAHSTWEDLASLSENKNFVTITPHPLPEEHHHQKILPALGFFALSIALVLFSDLRLSIALLVGALGMIISGVLSIDDAYKRVSWQTVFLLASLIPLGSAVQNTGTATWLAQHALNLLGDVPLWVLQMLLAILATAFTLVMSNVGATVLLVPLAVDIALQTHADPAIFALIIAIATSNSFILPTHQVNALIMGPGGYRVADYIRAGSIMTVLFLVILILMINLVFS